MVVWSINQATFQVAKPWALQASGSMERRMAFRVVRMVSLGKVLIRKKNVGKANDNRCRFGSRRTVLRVCWLGR